MPGTGLHGIIQQASGVGGGGGDERTRIMAPSAASMGNNHATRVHSSIMASTVRPDNQMGAAAAIFCCPVASCMPPVLRMETATSLSCISHRWGLAKQTPPPWGDTGCRLPVLDAGTWTCQTVIVRASMPLELIRAGAAVAVQTMDRVCTIPIHCHSLSAPRERAVEHMHQCKRGVSRCDGHRVNRPSDDVQASLHSSNVLGPGGDDLLQSHYGQRDCYP